MRYPLFLALAVGVLLAVALPRAAKADDYNANATIVRGVGVQTVTGLIAGGKYTIQCPNVLITDYTWTTDDGGVGGADAGYYSDSGYPQADAGGQRVYYRPGGCSACVTDAGPGDYLIDFSSYSDGYPVQLRAGMTKLHLRALDPSDQVYCSIFSRSP